MKTDVVRTRRTMIALLGFGLLGSVGFAVGEKMAWDGSPPVQAMPVQIRNDTAGWNWMPSRIGERSISSSIDEKPSMATQGAVGSRQRIWEPKSRLTSSDATTSRAPGDGPPSAPRTTDNPMRSACNPGRPLPRVIP